MRRLASLVACGLWLAGCAAPPQALLVPQPTACARLQWLGSTTIARDEPIHGATTGGISGLDYDAQRGDYVAISDDRSARGHARWMRLRVEQVPAGQRAGSNPWQARITELHPLRDTQGQRLLPRHAAPATQPVPDPEAIRLLPDGGLLWTDEGDPGRGFGTSLVRTDATGRQIARWFYAFRTRTAGRACARTSASRGWPSRRTDSRPGWPWRRRCARTARAPAPPRRARPCASAWSAWTTAGCCARSPTSPMPCRPPAGPCPSARSTASAKSCRTVPTICWYWSAPTARATALARGCTASACKRPIRWPWTASCATRRRWQPSS